MSMHYEDEVKMYDDLTSVPSNIKLTEVTSIQQKRLLAFINHFIFKTVDILNNFAQTCEVKLCEFETKIQRVEAALVILETKLSSIPNIAGDNDNLKTESVSEKNINGNNMNNESSPETIPLEELTKVKEVKLKDTPEYQRFFKMVEVGVPAQAVKLKLLSEGLDPNVLDDHS